MSLIVVVVSLIGPYIAPYGPSEFTPNLLKSPSKTYLMGSDSHGRDLFSRILRGGRITLGLAASTILLAGAIGIVWGMMAAYVTGFVGSLINRSIDLVMSFPSIMTALLVLAIVGTGGPMPLVLAIAFALAPRFARVIRGSTLPILKEDYVLAEKALGASPLRILSVHVLHNLIAPITVLTSIYLPYVIMLESSLSFLGLGAPPEVPTWGRIIADGKAYMQVAPWLTIFPGLAILFTALAFNLLGDGLRDILDPRSATRLYRQ
jgi:peptide/nickel transport system permease protein